MLFLCRSTGDWDSNEFGQLVTVADLRSRRPGARNNQAPPLILGRAGPRGVRGRGQDGKVGPPVDPVTRRGSGGITPGKFLKIYVNFGAIWCIFAPLAESLDSPVLQQNFKVCDSL